MYIPIISPLLGIFFVVPEGAHHPTRKVSQLEPWGVKRFSDGTQNRTTFLRQELGTYGKPNGFRIVSSSKIDESIVYDPCRGLTPVDTIENGEEAKILDFTVGPDEKESGTSNGQAPLFEPANICGNHERRR